MADDPLRSVKKTVLRAFVLRRMICPTYGKEVPSVDGTTPLPHLRIVPGWTSTGAHAGDKFDPCPRDVFLDDFSDWKRRNT